MALDFSASLFSTGLALTAGLAQLQGGMIYSKGIPSAIGPIGIGVTRVADDYTLSLPGMLAGVRQANGDGCGAGLGFQPQSDFDQLCYGAAGGGGGLVEFNFPTALSLWAGTYWLEVQESLDGQMFDGTELGGEFSTAGKARQLALAAAGGPAPTSPNLPRSGWQRWARWRWPPGHTGVRRSTARCGS